MTRRQKSVGDPMLVKLPDSSKGYSDSGEGGLAFFFVVLPTRTPRQACLAGGILWPQHDVCLDPELSAKNYNIEIDAGLLIGSTGESLFSDSEESYFCPKFSDLTSVGQDLYLRLERIYGKGSIKIVTLLDT